MQSFQICTIKKCKNIFTLGNNMNQNINLLLFLTADVMIKGPINAREKLAKLV
jgi:hypothetical protein